jgi:hypothetical protein
MGTPPRPPLRKIAAWPMTMGCIEAGSGFLRLLVYVL